MISNRDLKKLERLAEKVGPRDAKLIQRILTAIDELIMDNAELQFCSDMNLKQACDLARQLESRATPSPN